MKASSISILFFIVWFFSGSKLQASDIEVLKKNYIQATLVEGKKELIQLLTALPQDKFGADQVVVELMQRYPKTEAEISHLMAGLGKDGYWADIYYAGQKKSGWEPSMHAQRTLDLAIAYSRAGSALYHSEALAKSIHAALNYWFDHQFVSSNWWYNEIGVPKLLGPVFILFEDQLSATEKSQAITVMNKAQIGMSGQNKVWLAGNVLISGLLQDNFQLVQQARNAIVSEIVTGEPEGIQVDHSFHQHGPQQQFGNYGAAYVIDMSFWARIFGGTSLSLEQAQLDILSALINKGFQRIIWKGYMDVNGLGRQLYKQAESSKAIAVGFAVHNLLQLDSLNKSSYEALLLNAFSSHTMNPGYQGIYHFVKSDQTVSRRPQWMTSVKLSSRRVIGAEALNGDNLKGYYLADGATYTYVDGDEYNNIFPVWDWRKLPGVTAYAIPAPPKVLTVMGYRNNSRFVGNVTDGHLGLTSMELKRDGLVALKSWIFTDNYVFCLGAGITTTSDSVVTTSIEQRLKRSDLLLLTGKTWKKIEKLDISNAKGLRFFHHKTGYIVLGTNSIAARQESRSGSWHDIMQTYPKYMVDTTNVVSLWLDHGKKPKDAAYQYVILPASTPQKTVNFSVDDIQVLSNTAVSQVVYLQKEKAVLIAAYAGVDLKLPINTQFSTSTPGLYLLKYMAKSKQPVVMYSDPTQELRSVEFKVNGEKRRVDLSAK